MSLPECKVNHRCADGGEGACTQPEGHFGRHLCGSCLQLFGGSEGINPETGPVAERRAPAPASAPAGRVEVLDTESDTCAHCSWQFGSENQKWTCRCGKTVHLECFGKCASSFRAG